MSNVLRGGAVFNASVGFPRIMRGSGFGKKVGGFNSGGCFDNGSDYVERKNGDIVLARWLRVDPVGESFTKAAVRKAEVAAVVAVKERKILGAHVCTQCFIPRNQCTCD